MQSGQAIREAITLEREKEMEFNTLMQALVKDIAEQLRPMVVEMVREELANAEGDNAMAGIAHNIDLEKLAEHIDMENLVNELTDSQLNDIAGEIDLSDLAGEFDTDKIGQAVRANVDLDEVIRDFFQNNSFSIRA
jgi:Na+/phosphate symporter